MFQFWEEYPIYKSVKLSSAEVKTLKNAKFYQNNQKSKKKKKKLTKGFIKF